FNSAELQEDQLLLLLESLEEKIVSQQLELVREHTSWLAQRQGAGEGVDTSLLCFSREEEGELTMALVEMSGVRLQKGGAAVCTEDSFSAIAALYVSLYILNLLS
ncbi:GSDA3 protein, partial [Galbula dea]|nr:GSDA3 protein [Galbula dea]